ncbi:MAG: flavin reductase family protein [Chloroflexi bacterium]|nr:flavin reductase family protein [Chloroflexota bacterium]MCY3582430.1 flavin reductase family protein [Chloroflexota bacterium]MCY3716986.1 flavin reductase family protein [Chloroflexota bacterium]MDE2649800.1 flavin reductase family protein [Chloroflexota bacterium]MXV92526.1 flavin reductase family protein [Chloroflexota bacterium]
MVQHIEIDPASLGTQALFNVMTGSIVPRPIGWVSTVDRQGARNLAPYSMFTAVCAKPPTVVFCPSYQPPDFKEKDTYRNIATTGEFVINFVNDDTVQAMDTTAANVAPGVDEFELAGVTALPSKIVRPPRVAESPIAFECKLHELITIGLTSGGGHIVIGTGVYMHFQEGVYTEDNHIHFDEYRPIGGLVGHSYAHISDLFDIDAASSR